MTDLPHSCGSCSKRWTGFNTSHCLGCHETFTTVSNFDTHFDRRGRCADPAEAGLQPSSRAYPCWSTPPPPEGLRNLWSEADGPKEEA
jgi:hypothetical protein